MYVFRYDVIFFLRYGSLIWSSTPGGTESGVLPSLDGRFVVAEKFRTVGVWNAGTRKPGNVTVEEGVAASALCRACRPVLRANIVGDGGNSSSLRGCDSPLDAIQCCCSSKKNPAPAEHRAGPIALRCAVGHLLTHQTGGLSTTTKHIANHRRKLLRPGPGLPWMIYRRLPEKEN